MWKLVIEDDEGKRTVVPLTRDDYSIGRQEGNTIRLTERNVSRSHGRIKRKRVSAAPNGGNGSASKDLFVLEDRSSYNGLFVNGIRVATTQDLAHGDLVQIGDYRIVLQDDAVSAIETAAMPVSVDDTAPAAKQTVQMAASFRGQAMTERPNRMVMLVGPTPGVEYPLDRERMTIGRAEDSSISVNHNSVSRLHCEVHALGDGRFEIVDKGSSNGVRVNGVELRRSIIEAGDVIELGDVRFKFVGAGQVFVPGPNESQQLTAISDREAELVDPKRRGMGGYLLPILAAGVVGAVIIVVCVYALRMRVTPEVPPNPQGISQPGDRDPAGALVMEAKNACTIDDCEVSYQKVNTLPSTSTWRATAEFKQIVRTWAESQFKIAEGKEPGAKKAVLQRIEREPTLDEDQRARVLTQLKDLESTTPVVPTDLPNVTKDGGATTTVPLTGEPRANTTTPPSTANPHPVGVVPNPTVPKPLGACSVEKLREPGTAPNVIKNCLRDKVRLGRGTKAEEDLLALACKAPYDPACIQEINQAHNH